MATTYAKRVSQRVKNNSEKLDLRSRPAKSAIMADLKAKLASAEQKLKVAIAQNDTRKVAKLNEIIADLNETLSR